VVSAEIVLYKQGEINPLTAPAEIGEQGELIYRYDLESLEPGQYPPRAFSQITYRFQVQLENGEEFSTEDTQFDYIDNRFTWNEKESGSIRVHWYLGEESFAQEILDVAGQGLAKAQEFLPVATQGEIDIYVYASAVEMQAALLGGQDWVAGQSAPDLNVAVVSLPPDRPETRLEIRRQIPHELTHIWLYQYAGEGYVHLPTWLTEGLASLVELNPNPDYQTILEHAIQEDALIPIVSLCGSFPLDISGALLAYAEANSFTRFLHSQYGAPGLQKLVDSYAAGSDCLAGFEAALGGPLEQLEEQWLEGTLGVNALGQAFDALLPWLALFVIIVAIPLGFTFNGLLRWKDEAGLASPGPTRPA
jgi:hypothetical protein